MSANKEEIQVDAWLREHRVKRGIKDLLRKPENCRGSVPQLVELLQSPISLALRARLAKALFESELETPWRRKVMNAVLVILKENVSKAKDRDYRRLVELVPDAQLSEGNLVNMADATHVRAIGELCLDPRIGEQRKEFIYTLRMLGNPEAVSYLERAAGDPQIASYALAALALLRRDVGTLLARCEDSLKLPQVARKDEIEGLRNRLKNQLAEDARRSEANDWLRSKGVPHTISELYQNPNCCPDCKPVLLELFRRPISSDVRLLVAEALFARKPDRAQTQEAIEVLLDVIRQSAGQYNHPLSVLVLNTLAGRVDAGRVHEIGKMTLDPRYGQLRGEFTYVLRKIGNAEAISYLRRAAAQPETASLALDSLAHLRAEGTLELCEQALADPKVPYKDVVKEIYSKLKRRLAKKPATISHVTNEAAPKGLAEWSANLDGSDLLKVLRGIQKCVPEGFGKAEVAEVRSAADELSGDAEESGNDSVRLKFDIKFADKPDVMWLEVFCDDPEAFDLGVFGPAALIAQIESAMNKILGE